MHRGGEAFQRVLQEQQRLHGAGLSERERRAEELPDEVVRGRGVPGTVQEGVSGREDGIQEDGDTAEGEAAVAVEYVDAVFIYMCSFFFCKYCWHFFGFSRLYIN